MIFLNVLSNSRRRKRRVRLGRGIGSGHGKTCGRGHKGQKARSGGISRWFGGGQTSLIKRLPKRGFVSFNRSDFIAINTDDLHMLCITEKIKPGAEDVFAITVDILRCCNAITKNSARFKLLAGNSPVEHKFCVSISCSVAAKNLVLNAGGVIQG